MTDCFRKLGAVTIVAAFCLVSSGAFAQAASATTALTSAPQPAVQVAFITIGDRPAILFDAPSTKSNRIFILPRFQPVEVLVKLDKWTKVRDAEGTLGWIENTVIGDKHFVQVSNSTADVRSAASATSAIIFEAQKNVLLEVIGSATDGWLPVRHRDGQTGFVRTGQVWGG